MFTGIVARTGTVSSLQPRDFGKRLVIDPNGWEYQPGRGDSIAVNGCCLTHAPADETDAGRLCFDVVGETLTRTNLGRLTVGSAVNLESSLTASTPIAGHFVQGHIDAVAVIRHIASQAGDWRMSIELPTHLKPCVVPKGSIAVDGVSLTIAEVDPSGLAFTVALIPTTLSLTNLGARKVGDAVNLESDILARTVAHCLAMQLEAADGSNGERPNRVGLRELLDAAGFTGA